MPAPKRPVPDWLARLVDDGSDDTPLPIDTPPFREPDPDPRPELILIIVSAAGGVIGAALAIWMLT